MYISYQISCKKMVAITLYYFIISTICIYSISHVLCGILGESLVFQKQGHIENLYYIYLSGAGNVHNSQLHGVQFGLIHIGIDVPLRVITRDHVCSNVQSLWLENGHLALAFSKTFFLTHLQKDVFQSIYHEQ